MLFFKKKYKNCEIDIEVVNVAKASDKYPNGVLLSPYCI